MTINRALHGDYSHGPRYDSAPVNVSLSTTTARSGQLAPRIPEELDLDGRKPLVFESLAKRGSVEMVRLT